MLVAVVFDVVDQLAQVLQAVCRILVALGRIGFQHGLVAGHLNDILGKFVQCPGFQRFLQFFVDLPEFQQRHNGAAEFGVCIRVGDDFQHTDALLGGKVSDHIDGGVADLPGRLVDDAAQAHIIPGVRHDGHIGVNVLDLFAVVEALAAHDLMGNARAGKVAFDGGRLGIHAVEHRMVRQMPALFQVLTDDICNVHGFVLLILGSVDLHLVTLVVPCPQGLALALGVVLDDAIGSIQDVGGGAVILLQTDGLGAGEDALKVQNVLNGGTAETVDALVIVTDNADVLFRAGEQADQPELGHAGILILVHQQVAVLVLVELPHILVLRQQLHGLVDQVVEVEGSCLPELFLVGGVDFGGNGSLGVPGRGAQRLLRADQLVLPAAHLVDGALDREELIVDAQFLIDRLHHTLGIIGIIDGKAAGVADGFCPAAQDAHTGRVEGGGKHLVPLFAAQHIAQALLELPCRLVGKGDGHHVPAADSVLPQHPVQPGGRIGAGHNCRFQSLDIILGHLTGGPAGTVGRAKPDQVCDAVDQNSGLAAACTGQNEQRAVGGKYRLPLHIVQAAKLLFNIGIAQSAEFLLETCCHCFTCSSIKSLTL